MSSREVEGVCNYLRNRDIQLSTNNSWLLNCINWYNSHLELREIYGSLEDYVCVQWLLADLQDVHSACLPANCQERVVHFNGKFAVQVNCVRDIGKSCYSQLQAVQRCDDPDNYISEDEPKKQNWEPRANRVLMMEVTDGITKLKAMEYSHIPKLLEPFIPGTKVVLIGPIECRNGILLLKNENVKLLGGEVEQLSKKYSLETILSRCLNLVTENEIEESENNTVPSRLTNNVTNPTRPQHSAFTNNMTNPTRPQHSAFTNNMTNPTRPQHSAFTTNDDVSAMDRSNFMMDEDDEFLCELPDEVLECPEDREPQSSPVLYDRTFETNRRVIPQVQRSSYEAPTAHPPVRTNKFKPKLFPSLEDLSSVGRESSSFSNTIEADVSRSTMGTTNTEVNISLNKSLDRPSTSNQSVTNNLARSHNVNAQNVVGSISQGQSSEINLVMDDESMDYNLSTVKKYPQLKKVEIKVDNITKLKIRNGEWFCCGSVLLENQQLNITFSNEVLETLFGIPASEVEVWRGEMSTNPTLKKKVNDILKTGQTKLKILRCPMTLQYSSEDCTPQVIAIHMP